MNGDDLGREEGVVRRSQIVVAVALGVAVLASPVAAQEGTPATELPVTPDPAECMAAPRPTAEFAALVGTPVPAPRESFERPRGDAADAETAAAVTATVRELVACLNAGDWRRAAALYTDAGFAVAFVGTSEQDLAVLEASPQPVEEMGRVVLIAVREIERLPDGRVGAVVVTGAEGTPDMYTFLFFTEGDDRWLVDDVVDGYDPSREATPDAGTSSAESS
jgi:hypothetical protein